MRHNNQHQQTGLEHSHPTRATHDTQQLKQSATAERTNNQEDPASTNEAGFSRLETTDPRDQLVRIVADWMREMAERGDSGGS